MRSDAGLDATHAFLLCTDGELDDEVWEIIMGGSDEEDDDDDDDADDEDGDAQEDVAVQVRPVLVDWIQC